MASGFPPPQDRRDRACNPIRLAASFARKLCLKEAFSAYLRLKGHRLITSDKRRSKVLFTFEVEGNPDQLKVDFINSELIRFYNELRNLKKMLSVR